MAPSAAPPVATLSLLGRMAVAVAALLTITVVVAAILWVGWLLGGVLLG